MLYSYNYGPRPTPFFNNNTDFEFVPMFFSPSIENFASTMKNLTKDGTNITHILSYHEPDGSTGSGGSNVKASDAASAWISTLEPLRKDLDVKLGAPAVTGSPMGLEWLTSFFNACDGGCTADFLPIHWYGNFDGLVWYMGEVRKAYPDLPVWITEYALPNAPLNDTQYFFNQSTNYFDSLNFVERYSYFGSFPSSASNVGKNPSMLDSNGKLTDIGSWYLGGSATGVVPNSAGKNIIGLGASISVLVGFWLVL
jgi:hypothetical protein